MKLSSSLMYAGNPRQAADDVAALETAGLDSIWVAEAYGYSFDLGASGFRDALCDASGAPLAEERVWTLLDLFFEGEMRAHGVLGPGRGNRAL